MLVNMGNREKQEHGKLTQLHKANIICPERLKHRQFILGCAGCSGYARVLSIFKKRHMRAELDAIVFREHMAWSFGEAIATG